MPPFFAAVCTYLPVNFVRPKTTTTTRPPIALGPSRTQLNGECAHTASPVLMLWPGVCVYEHVRCVCMYAVCALCMCTLQDWGEE
jgi:hypothetical protein